MKPIMEHLKIDDKFIHLDALNEERLLKTMVETWEQKEEIVKPFKSIVAEQRKKASDNGKIAAYMINDGVK